MWSRGNTRLTSFTAACITFWPAPLFWPPSLTSRRVRVAPPVVKAKRKAGFILLCGRWFPHSLLAGPCGVLAALWIFRPQGSVSFAWSHSLCVPPAFSFSDCSVNFREPSAISSRGAQSLTWKFPPERELPDLLLRMVEKPGAGDIIVEKYQR